MAHRRMSVQLHFDHHVCDAPAGASLFQLGTAAGIQVPTSCREQGRCKECVVEVTEGLDRLTPRAPEEQHLRGPFRLSCRTRVQADAGVVRCQTMRRGAMRIEQDAFELPLAGRPGTLDPAVTRDRGRILLDDEEIERSDGPLHGVALDLGTTTVVVKLLNLETGAVVAATSFENPQRFGGSDVMARIQYDTEDGTKTLQRTLAGYLSRALAGLPADPRTIYEVVVAGNSTMRDLFFRLPVHSIGQSPYQSVTESELAAGLRGSTSVVDTGRRLGLPIHPRGRVYGLPIISGHVGADAAACMLAIDLAHEDRLVALMDIGTNTELILGNRHRVLAASCPAGPAFEGGQIAFGMPGLTGAIEKVAIAADGSVHCQVIGGGEPEGICGSGLVDLLSELRRTEQMNALGRFEQGGPIVVATTAEGPITFSESDVNALAQAKGANVAGLRVALAEYGVPAAALDVFYLAGGFGRRLGVAAAQRIGLVPDLPAARVRQIGNASIAGASIALLSRAKRAELEGLVRRVTHCRLETHRQFFDLFVDGCQFHPFGAGSPSRSATMEAGA
jgi:uncharacterized 2Fe-2S/4Fe-4S cluster protein (DUF4445 family)